MVEAGGRHCGVAGWQGFWGRHARMQGGVVLPSPGFLVRRDSCSWRNLPGLLFGEPGSWIVHRCDDQQFLIVSCAEARFDDTSEFCSAGVFWWCGVCFGRVSLLRFAVVGCDCGDAFGLAVLTAIPVPAAIRFCLRRLGAIWRPGGLCHGMVVEGSGAGRGWKSGNSPLFPRKDCREDWKMADFSCLLMRLVGAQDAVSKDAPGRHGPTQDLLMLGSGVIPLLSRGWCW